MQIGRYEVLSHLATGGMAQIYLARQTGLGSFERHVVLKTILRERATDQRFVTMFLDEARLAATLNHQNVAQVYEVDQADGAYFMAMEYVHGENTRAILETTIRRGWTVPLELAIMIINGAAAGLHHAHERRGKNGQPLNIVHRDVSPANIMVGFDGSVKVLDFGIAKAEERATKTIGGTIKGKYGYMSPEQCKGQPIDRRSDIFALGIVLYELTTLRRAFKGNDDFETMKRIVAGDLVLPSTVVPGFPRELEAIILTALASDSSARFQTGQELIEALDAFVVRAKLTGSNTAMGRFMLQLFGTKKEPWIDAAAQSLDHTLVTPAEVNDDNDQDEADEEDDDEHETLVLSSRQAAQNIINDLNAPSEGPTVAGAPRLQASRITPRTPASGEVPTQPLRPRTSGAMPVQAPRPSGALPSQPSRPSGAMPVPPRTTTSGAMPVQAPRPRTSGAMPVQAPRTTTSGAMPVQAPRTTSRTPVTSAPQAQPSRPTGTPHPQPHVPSHSQQHPVPVLPPSPAQVEIESAGWPTADPARRLSARRSAERPSLPFASQGVDRTPPPAPTDESASSNPVLAMTIIGQPSPVPPPAGPGTGLPRLIANEDVSEVGAQPLVTDSRLGWDLNVRLAEPSDGGHTRLQSGPKDFRIRSSARWILLAIVLVLGIAIGLAVFFRT